MKNSNKVEVLLSQKYLFQRHTQKALLSWLVILQPLIQQKQVVSKKLFLKSLVNTPPIYLS